MRGGRTGPRKMPCEWQCVPVHVWTGTPNQQYRVKVYYFTCTNIALLSNGRCLPAHTIVFGSSLLGLCMRDSRLSRAHNHIVCVCVWLEFQPRCVTTAPSLFCMHCNSDFGDGTQTSVVSILFYFISQPASKCIRSYVRYLCSVSGM